MRNKSSVWLPIDSLSTKMIRNHIKMQTCSPTDVPIGEALIPWQLVIAAKQLGEPPQRFPPTIDFPVRLAERMQLIELHRRESAKMPIGLLESFVTSSIKHFTGERSALSPSAANTSAAGTRRLSERKFWEKNFPGVLVDHAPFEFSIIMPQTYLHTLAACTRE